MLKRLVLAAIVLPALGLGGCSGSSSSPSAPLIATPTPSPVSTATPTAVPTATGATPTPSPTASGATPTPMPSGVTPTPVSSPSGPPVITGSLTSIVVCAQQQSTCAADLNPNATSGESAGVLVLNVRGSLSYTNAGGAAIGTMASQVYATHGDTTEYLVTYKAATSVAATDTLTIKDSGTQSSLKIPVTIVDPGSDAGASFFALGPEAGTVCAGSQVAFETKTQGDATIVLSASDDTLVSIGQNGTGNFAVDLLRAGSGYITATAASSTVIYPANIPATGFTTSC